MDLFQPWSSFWFVCDSNYSMMMFEILLYILNMFWNHVDLCLLQGKKIDATPLAMYNYFIERVKQNLHIVLAMSPIGDAFRNRVRQFPSLINCCTIDWFQVRLLISRIEDARSVFIVSCMTTEVEHVVYRKNTWKAGWYIYISLVKQQKGLTISFLKHMISNFNTS